MTDTAILYKLHDTIMEILDEEDVDVSIVPVGYKDHMRQIGAELAESVLAIINSQKASNK